MSSVTRKSKFDRPRRTGRPDERLLETIVEDIVKAAAMPEDDWRALSQFPLPALAIPVSEGREYRATQAGIDAAHELTDQAWDECEDFRQTIERGAFDRLSFRAIGQGLRAAVARALEKTGMQMGTGNSIPPSTKHSPLTSGTSWADSRKRFAPTSTSTSRACCSTRTSWFRFSVGPVEFLPRADWIDRFVRDGEARTVVERLEKADLTIEEVRRRP